MQEEQNIENYQVLVTQITWNKDTIKGFNKKAPVDQLPDQCTVDLPKQLASQVKQSNFKDNVETFIYNMLTRRYGHEVYSCQIWLPLEEETKVA